MSTEFPQPKKELTEAEWQKLKQDAIQWRDRIRETTEEASASCKHILRNLAVGPGLVADLDMKAKNIEPQTYSAVLENIEYIKRYYKLLEDYPDFAEKESAEGEGYFPELMKAGGGAHKLVEEYEERLKSGELRQ